MTSVQVSPFPTQGALPVRDWPGPRLILVAVSDPDTAAAIGEAGAELARSTGSTVTLFTSARTRESWSTMDQRFLGRTGQDLALSRARSAMADEGVPCSFYIDQRRFEWPAPSRRRLAAEEIARFAAGLPVEHIVVGESNPSALGRGVAQHLRRMTPAPVVEIPCHGEQRGLVSAVRRMWV